MREWQTYKRATISAGVQLLVATGLTWGCRARTPSAPPQTVTPTRLQFQLELATENCPSALEHVVLQLDQAAPSKGKAYRFDVTPGQALLNGSILDLPEGTYHATATGRTLSGVNTCASGDTVLVSSLGTGRSTLKLTCSDTCVDAAAPVKAELCPALELQTPATAQFTTLPFALSAVIKNTSNAPTWSSPDLTLNSTTGKQVTAQCKSPKKAATVELTASNQACAVDTTVSVTCVDAEVTTLSEADYVPSGWSGADERFKFPATREVFRQPCAQLAKANQRDKISACREVGSYCTCETQALRKELPQLNRKEALRDGPVIGSSGGTALALDTGFSEEQLDQVRAQLSALGRAYLGVPPAPSAATINGRSKAAAPPKGPAQELVRVAVIDTTGVSPFNSDGTPTQPADNSPHGRAVALVINDSACGGHSDVQSCPVKVRNYLALSVIGTNTGATAAIGVDTTHGGNAGTLSDLSAAIRQAVDDWKPSSATTRLIVNISAGWDPVWGGAATNLTDSAGVSGTPELVLRSLQYAWCHGALIFAAAGNSSGSANSSQAPIFPAAWTSLTPPSQAQCQTLAPSLPSEATANRSHALLYAVGALDLWGQPLAITRTMGMPPLASVGFAVTRGEPYGTPRHTAVLTGTSMSTAAVSGIAAYTWAMAPRARANQIATDLYTQGQAVIKHDTFCPGGTVCPGEPVFSNFCPSGACQTIAVHNVALCPPNVPQAGCVAPPLPETIELPNLPLVVTAEAALVTEPEPPSDPSAIHPTQQPWVYPQPGDPPSCRVCQFANPTDILDIDMVNSPYNPASVLSMRVTLKGQSGYWTIPADIIARRDFRVTLRGALSNRTSGTLTYMYDLGFGVVEIKETIVAH
jgi:hypothetical protein